MTLLRYATGLFLFGHGFAHLVGFVVAWRIARLEEMPYKTTLLAGAADVGHAGIRLVGILWLLGALAFAAAGVGLALSQPWWMPLTLWASGYSLVLCLLGWPDSKIGVPINVAIVVWLTVGARWGWVPWMQG